MSYSIEQHHGSCNIQKRTTAVKYIVVHYTGSGTSAAGSAKANCTYFAGGNRNASAHYFIDDATICEYAEPSAYVTWHCGDGKGRYGITNANSVGIEVCNSGGAFSAAEISRLAWLVQKLMARFGVDAAHVVRHYDASRKRCPAYYVDNAAAWTALHSTITNGGSAAESEDEEVTDQDKQDIANLVWSVESGRTTADRAYRNCSMLKAMCGIGAEDTSDPKGNHDNIKAWTVNRWERSLRILKGLAGIGQDDTTDSAIKTPLAVTLSDEQMDELAKRVAKALK